MGIKYLYHYALGKFDCAIGNEALEGQSEAYYDGYNAVSYTHLTLPTKRIV